MDHLELLEQLELLDPKDSMEYQELRVKMETWD